MREMKQCVGAEHGRLVDLRIEIPEIGNALRLGITGAGSEQSVPVLRCFGAQCECINAGRSESTSAPSDSATDTGSTQPIG